VFKAAARLAPSALLYLTGATLPSTSSAVDARPLGLIEKEIAMVNRKSILKALTLLVTGLPLTDAWGQSNATTYRSPYTVEFTIPLQELTGDLDKSQLGDPTQESTIAFPLWYSNKVRDRYGS
jgi:hypothetical protein